LLDFLPKVGYNDHSFLSMTRVEKLHCIGGGARDLDGAHGAASGAIDVLYTFGRDLVTVAVTHLATFANHIRGDLPM
jgi:hypothetical protein